MPKRLTTEDFIIKANEKHNFKYDYSKVEYINAHSKVIIICLKHGEFLQNPSDHLSGYGCPTCANKNITTRDFIERSSLKHNFKYDYSNAIYVDAKTKVKIICSIHGEFETEASGHLGGRGCPKCRGLYKTTDEFIAEASFIHNNKFDYSLVNYASSTKKVRIICPEHGEFLQSPNAHLGGKYGCPKCGVKASHSLFKLNKDEFIVRANNIHNNKYTYLNYGNGVHDKIDVLCPEHGLFSQKIYSHLDGHGCPTCGVEDTVNKNRFEWDDVLKTFIETHGDRYNYSKVNYINIKTPVCIICSSHGEFWQSPSQHSFNQGCPLCGYENSAKLRLLPFETVLSEFRRVNNNKYDYSKFVYVNGRTKGIVICHEKDKYGNEHGEFLSKAVNHKLGNGCPKCGLVNNVMELQLYNNLKNNFSKENILYQHSTDWLLYQSFDMYFLDYNIAVEYHGIQHFKPVDFFGGEESFKDGRARDIKKYDLSVDNNCKIFYFTYKKKEIFDYPYYVEYSENKLFSDIQNEIYLRKKESF